MLETEIKKPKLSAEGQIAHLQSKGVKFEKFSTDEAKAYLQANNNYFKLRAYRKNFPKHPDGEQKGQYINLDFEYLRDLSIIDMRLRYVIIQMALDIEHFAKVKLLQALENSSEDGYKIVEDYYEYLKDEDKKNGTHKYSNLEKEIGRNGNNPYCGGIIRSYNGRFPMWAFIEIIPLGSFINFFKFCANRFEDKFLENDFYLLKTIKELRNATAHSNCLINEMGVKNSHYSTNYHVLRALDQISKSSRDSQLKNECMRQIVTLIYLHSAIVTSEGVHERAKKDLNSVADRMFKNIDFYSNNSNILAFFAFFKKTVDILFP